MSQDLFFSLSKPALFKSLVYFTNQVKNMSLKIKVFIVIISIFVKLSFGLWPYSSQGQSDICFIENKLEIVCDCTEPNVICRGLNLTDINYILPDGTELVNFARNSLVEVQTGLVWPTSIVEINLSQNKIKRIQPKVKLNQIYTE